MFIKETIKANVSLKAHPVGLKNKMKHYFEELEDKENIDGAKNVLIIGGSSGYGLATRIVASSKMNANTINVCYETPPKLKKTGTAGYWNMKFFNECSNTKSIDYNIDAFADESIKKVVNKLNAENIKIDLVVFSLAAGAKITKNGLVTSSLKPIGKDITGKTIDIAKNCIKTIEIKQANQQEIDDTVFVMGGLDWYNWIKHLVNNNCLTSDCKTISYTYIGSDPTKDIYRNGTIGKAKDDLEKTVDKINTDFNVDASVVSAKAIASKASVFIPSMSIYAGCLYEVMQNNGTHETITQHIYRLFNELIYSKTTIKDDKNRIRLDSFEIDKDVQQKTLDLMNNLSDEELLNLKGTKDFIKEFYNINGFRVDGIDYELEVDLNYL
ncbi:MAG: enoyl-[acyl-carrier-protein] reductase FabV [Bacilli bacterium]